MINGWYNGNKKNILIKNATILNPKSAEKDNIESFKGDLLIENDKIAEISKKNEELINSKGVEKIIDGKKTKY